MTDDRVYPSTKPILNPPSSHQTLNGGGGPPPPSFPPTKSQLYGASRPTYRPQPKEYHRSSRRSCCCSCCLWTTVIIITLILLTTITGVVFYVIYRPHRPSFSVTTLRIPQFNITTSKDSTSHHLNSKLDLTISARNPNNKVIFYYDPIIVSVKSNGIDIGDGSFSSFIHGTKNTTLLKASLTSTGGGKELDSVSVKSLNSDLKKKSGLPLDIQLDTKVKVKMGGLKTNKVMIRVSCSGIQAQVASKTSKASVISSNVDCKVKLRIKIWKWTIG